MSQPYIFDYLIIQMMFEIFSLENIIGFVIFYCLTYTKNNNTDNKPNPNRIDTVKTYKYESRHVNYISKQYGVANGLDKNGSDSECDSR